MVQRLYIDVNSGIGRINIREKRIPYKVESLLEDMKYYRVHASIVCSNLARDYSFVKRNKELISDIKKNVRLYGIATVINDIQYELGEGYRYYDRLLHEGIKAFKVYPKSFSHGFDPFSMEDLAEYMVSMGIRSLASKS